MAVGPRIDFSKYFKMKPLPEGLIQVQFFHRHFGHQ
jgi:hypothetical protein